MSEYRYCVPSESEVRGALAATGLFYDPIEHWSVSNGGTLVVELADHAVTLLPSKWLPYVEADLHRCGDRRAAG